MKQASTHAAKQSIVCALAAIACAILAATPATHAQCQYEVTAIIQGPPCWPSNNPAVLYGTGMNNHGHVTGYHFDCFVTSDDHGFYWTPQTGLVTMHKPQNVWRVQPRDINDHGLIVGSLEITDLGKRGFVYDIKTQQYTYLLPKTPLFGSASLSAINNAGIAVGSRSIGKPGQSPNPSNAVIWNTNTGEALDLGVMNGPNSEARSIADCGSVVGWSGGATTSSTAFVYQDGKLVDLGLPLGAHTSWANAYGANVVVGTGVNLNTLTSRAYLWRDGKYLAIIEPHDGFMSTQGIDVNTSGQVLYRNSADASNIVGALWQNGEGWLLADLVAGDPSIDLDRPKAITDTGRILLESGTRAAVLSPIGKPVGDLNHDCQVNVDDLLILLHAWGPTRARGQGNLAADLNGDGIVNVADLLILLAHWGH